MNGNDFNLNNMAQRYKDEMMRLYRKSSSAPQTGNAPAQQTGQPSPQTASQTQTQPRSSHTNMPMPPSVQHNMPMAAPNGSPMSSTTHANQSDIHISGNTVHMNDHSTHINSNATPISEAAASSARADQNAPNMNMSRDIAGTPIPGVPGASHFAAEKPSDMSLSLPVSCECRFPSAESIIESIAGIPTPPVIRPEDNPPPVYPGNSMIQPRMTPYENPAPRGANPDMGGTFSQADKTAYQRTGDTSLRGMMLNGSPEGGVYSIPSEAETEREILPDFPLPTSSTESIPSTVGLTPSLSWVSLTGDNSWGYLQFDVFTAGGAYPVPGAVVAVKKVLPGGVGLVRLMFTDRSGRTPTIALPAPSASLSQNPMNTARPFSEYNVTVRAKGYYTLSDINIPIFVGVKTVQPIDLIPLPEYPEQTPIQPRSDIRGNGMTDENSVG
ncbi:MAG: hypothetical protein J5997_08120 [Oscillospiraceae bacterium]|nr:hypothetical protein [Oscillospiraceae bacterium]